MVRIRFRRVGGKKQPSYRLVVADQRSARNGGIIESIGYHNPRTQPSTDIVDEARVLHWLSVGAQPSESVVYLLKRTGTLARFERLKAGESIETLVAEANANVQSVSPKTRYASPEAGQGTFKPKGE
ncbi:MAG: 30S ribosomal protein S16 [Anaerolineae bacterium]|nr:30S ribosomal protein S16 [Anaerolineae bacterium]